MRLIIIALLFISTLFSGVAAAENAPIALEEIEGVNDSIIVAPALGSWMVVAAFNDLSDPSKGATELAEPELIYTDVNATSITDVNGIKHEVVSMVGRHIDHGTQITIVTKDRPTVRTLFMTRPDMAPLAIVVEVDDTLGVIKAVFVNVVPLK